LFDLLNRELSLAVVAVLANVSWTDIGQTLVVGTHLSDGRLGPRLHSQGGEPHVLETVGTETDVTPLDVVVGHCQDQVLFA